MKQFLLLALLFCAPAFAPFADAQFVNITDTGITDENGLVLANGQECFTPVSAAQYTGGTMVKQTKCLPIAAGVMQPTTLLSSGASSPNNLCYQRVIKNTDTSKTVIGPGDGWDCVTFFKDTNLNTVPPHLPDLALVSPGPVGATGPAGALIPPDGVNLINPTVLLADTAPGIYGTGAGAYVPGAATMLDIPVMGAAFVTSNQTLYGDANHGIYFVAADGTPLNVGGSGSPYTYATPTPAGTLLPVPSGAVRMAACVRGGDTSQWMLVRGTKLPPTFQPYWLSALTTKLDTSATHYRGTYVSGANYLLNDIVLFNGLPYVATANNAGSPAVPAVPAVPAHLANDLFVPSTARVGIQVGDIHNNAVGNLDTGFTAYTTSAHMTTVGGTTYTSTWGAGDSNGLYGSVWWSGSTAVKEEPIPYGNGASFTAPPNTDSFTITFNGGSASTEHFGVLVPATAGSPAVPAVAAQPPTNTAFWQPLLTANTSGTDSAATHYKGAYLGSASYVPGDLVTYSGGSYLNILATAATGPTQLFNPASSRVGIQVGDIHNNAVGNLDTGFTAYTTSAHIPVTPGLPYAMSWGAGDSNGLYGSVWWSGATAVAEWPIPYANGASVTAPPGVDSITITFNGGPASTQMFVQGTLPSSYVAYGQPVSGGALTNPANDTTHWVAIGAAQASSSTHAAVSNLNGKRFGVLGDSISNGLYGLWQPTVTARTGATNPYNNSRPGRQYGQVFECYGATSIGATLSTNQGTISTPSGTYVCPGSPGNTLAQDLAGLDYMDLFMGTNDANDPMGSPGDPVTTNTVYGALNWMQTTLNTANPGMRLLYITPYRNGFGNATTVSGVICAFANSAGQPCLNLMNDSGIYPGNWASTLLGDTTHPTPLGYTKYVGPAIANRMETVFP